MTGTSPTTTTEPTEIDYAYLAGLIDGEGHIGIYGQRSPCPRLEISMTDEATIDWLLTTFGGTRYTPRAHSPNARQYWKWTVTVAWLREHILAILPHLKTKRRHAEIITEYMSLRIPYVGSTDPERVEELCQELKHLNKRGQ